MSSDHVAMFRNDVSLFVLSAFENLFRFVGEFLPRHLQIFKSNQFFHGISIPEPDHVESLESRVHTNDKAVIDFLHVSIPC